MTIQLCLRCTSHAHHVTASEVNQQTKDIMHSLYPICPLLLPLTIHTHLIISAHLIISQANSDAPLPTSWHQNSTPPQCNAISFLPFSPAHIQPYPMSSHAATQFNATQSDPIQSDTSLQKRARPQRLSCSQSHIVTSSTTQPSQPSQQPHPPSWGPPSPPRP